MELAATSTEYVHVPVIPPEGVSLDATPVKVAIVGHSANPADSEWRSATWQGNTARILVGPSGGAVSLTAGSYWAWITWTAGSETPVYRAGRIRVY